MDIATNRVLDAAVFDRFYDPNGEILVDEQTEAPINIELYGEHTSVFRKALGRQYRENQKRNGFKQKSKKEEELIDPNVLDESYNTSVETLARCTKSWSGFYQNGEPLECNFENAVAVYNALPHVRKQAEDYQRELSGFLQKPSNSSAYM